MSMKEKQRFVCVFEAKHGRFLVSKRLEFSQGKLLAWCIFFFFLLQEYFEGWRGRANEMDWSEGQKRFKNDGKRRKLVLWNVYGKGMVEWLYENFAFSFVANEISFPGKWNFALVV